MTPAYIRTPLRTLVIALGYFLLGELALMLALAPGEASLVFPAAGLAVAAVAFWGVAGAAGVFFGAVLLQLQAPLDAGLTVDWARGGVAGLAALLQAGLGVWLLKRFNPALLRGDFSLRALTLFLLLVLVFCTVSATFSLAYIDWSQGLQAGLWANAWTWWLGDSVGVLLFLPLLILLMNRQIEGRLASAAVVAPLLIVLLGVLSTVQFFLQQQAYETLVERYDVPAERVDYELTAQHALHAQMLQTLASVVQAFPSFSYQHFNAITEKLYRGHSDLQALALSFLVDHPERQRFEADMADALVQPGFQVRDKQSGVLETAQPREQYVAVAYINPTEGNEAAVGFDVASNSKRLAALQAAAQKGTLQVTAPIDLVQETATQPGYLMLHPVQMPAGYAGVDGKLTPGANAFVVAVIRAGDLIHYHAHHMESQGLALRVWDGEHLVYEHASFASGSDASQLLVHEETIPFANRVWRMQVYANAKVFYASLAEQLTLVSLLSLALVALLQALVLLVLNQTRLTRQQVTQKTLALAEQQKRSTSIFEEAPEAYFIFDGQEGRVMECNRSAEKMLGGTREQIIGLSVNDLSPEKQPDGVPSTEASAPIMVEIFRDGGKRFDWVHQRLNGQPFWAEIDARVVELAGELTLVATWRDISDRKALEEEKALALEALAKKQAKQEKLFAIIGHELRTPAAALHMLAEGDQLDRTQLQSTSAHLLSVLDDMRAVIRPDEVIKGRLEVSSVAAEVNAVVALQRPLLKSQDMQLHVQLAPESEQACTLNAQLLRQVLLNLTKNAAIHSGGSQLWITVVPEAEAYAYRIVIADDGHGVAADDVASLFDPFARGDTKAEGSGLGLHVSRDLARRELNGDLSYAPREGGGATFTLVLQFAEPNAPVSVSEAKAPLDNLRILFAEDNPLIRNLSSQLLRVQNALVDEAEDGAQALALLQSNDYDLLITDLFMPVMDGFELASKARALNKTLPIVAISAAILGTETEQALAAGVDAVLAKPLVMEQLQRTLTQVRNQHAGESADDTDANARAFAGDSGDLFAAHSAMPPEALVDFDQVAAMTDGAAALQEVVFASFEEDAPEYFAKVKQALAREDFAKLKREAHAMKGLGRVLYAEPLVRACEALEQAALAAELGACQRACEQIESLLDKVLATLKAHRASAGGA